MTKLQPHLTIFWKKTTSRKKKMPVKALNTCCSCQMKTEHYSQLTKFWPCTWSTSLIWSSSITLSSHLPQLTPSTLNLARKKHLLELSNLKGIIISSTWQHASSFNSTEDALTTQSTLRSKTSLWATTLTSLALSATPIMKKDHQIAFHLSAMISSLITFHLSATSLTTRQLLGLHSTWSFGSITENSQKRSLN